MPKGKLRETNAETLNAADDEAGKEWLIADFMKTNIEKVNGEFVTKFLVKWRNHPKKTWEPMEMLAHCPLLFGNYAIREHKKLLKKVRDLNMTTSTGGGGGDDDDDDLPNFSTIPSDILANFKDPDEYIPTGREIVMNILCEGKKENGLVLWSVIFKTINGVCKVRKCVMEYYFPGEAAFFHMYQRKQAKRHAAVVRANQRQ